MTAPMPATRRQVWAWGFYDWGSNAFQTVIVTFVFSVYLVQSVGADLPGPIDANTWLGISLGAAGLLIALIAPVIGQRVDGTGRRRLSVGVWSALTIACTAGLVAVQDDASYLWLGLTLIAVGSIFFQLAEVSYFAMLRHLCTPATIGRTSGFGWSMGYFGGIVLLLIVYLGLIVGDGGLLGVSTDNGWNIRLVAIVAAVWFAVFTIPLLRSVPEPPRASDLPPRLGVVGSYRRLFADVRALYRANPHTVYFLGASALFRDGLSGVFTFGAVLAVTVYGISPGDVLLFAIAANVVAGLGALAGGYGDDRVGPKAVIVGSLTAMIASGTILYFLDGPVAFWILGMALSVFVGPAQAASRSYLARMTPPGREGQMFGLYATTGRAVSFLSPSLFALFTFLFDSQRAGILGIIAVLVLGLVALVGVRSPGNVESARV